MSEHMIQSYVWYQDKLFFVSTMNRDSSSMYAYGTKYAETMVWECNPQTRERYEIILWIGDAPKDKLVTHFEACRALRQDGKIEE